MLHSTPVPHQVMHSRTLRLLMPFRWSNSLIANHLSAAIPPAAFARGIKTRFPESPVYSSSHKNRVGAVPQLAGHCFSARTVGPTKGIASSRRFLRRLDVPERNQQCDVVEN